MVTIVCKIIVSMRVEDDLLFEPVLNYPFKTKLNVGVWDLSTFFFLGGGGGGGGGTFTHFGTFCPNQESMAESPQALCL